MAVGALARIGYTLPASALFHAEWLDGVFSLTVGITFFLAAALLILAAYTRARQMGTMMAAYGYIVTIFLAGILGLIGLMALLNGAARILDQRP
jgi:hypothetical protein